MLFCFWFFTKKTNTIMTKPFLGRLPVFFRQLTKSVAGIDLIKLSPGLVVTRNQESVSSNPGTGYWTFQFSHLVVVKFCCLKRPITNEKEVGVAHSWIKILWNDNTKKKYLNIVDSVLWISHLTELFWHMLYVSLVQTNSAHTET